MSKKSLTSLINNCSCNIHLCFSNVLSINVNENIRQYSYHNIVCEVSCGYGHKNWATSKKNILILLLFQNCVLHTLLLNKMYDNFMYIYRYIFSRGSIVKNITCFSSRMVFYRQYSILLQNKCSTVRATRNE